MPGIQARFWIHHDGPMVWKSQCWSRYENRTILVARQLLWQADGHHTINLPNKFCNGTCDILNEVAGTAA